RGARDSDNHARDDHGNPGDRIGGDCCGRCGANELHARGNIGSWAGNGCADGNGDVHGYDDGDGAGNGEPDSDGDPTWSGSVARSDDGDVDHGGGSARDYGELAGRCELQRCDVVAGDGNGADGDRDNDDGDVDRDSCGGGIASDVYGDPWPAAGDARADE